MGEKLKNFGLDIDGTVTCPSTFVPYINKSFNLNISLDDITEYDLIPLLGITEEEFYKWMTEHECTIYSNAPFAKGAKQTINDWKDHHNLIYISARGKHLYETTSNWMNQHQLPFDHIELIGHHNKIEAVKAHDIDIFFEDKHDNAVAVGESCNIPVILFDTPYNREPVPQNVIRVKDWLEAKKWVDHWNKGE